MKKINPVLVIISILTLLFLNCSYQSNSNKSQVTIYTGLNQNNNTISASRAPSGITSLALTVTGDGDTLFEETYTDSSDFDELTIDLENGDDRTFFIVATSSTSPYTGLTIADISSSNSTVTVTMDTTFNVVSDPNTSQWDEPEALAVDDDYIYIAGYYHDGTGRKWRIEKRSKLDGALVSGFGTGGFINESTITAGSEPRDIIVDGQYIYIVGYEENGGGDFWRIEKRDITTGNLDSNFGSSGIVNYNIIVTAGDYADAYTIISDSTYIYTGGILVSNGLADSRIEKRLKTNGNLVTSFGSPNGYLHFNGPGSGNSFLKSISIDSNYIYAVGKYWNGSDEDRYIERITIGTGVQDIGWISVLSDAGNDDFTSVILDSNSNLFVSGNVPDSYPHVQWRLEKRNVNTGSLVSAFSNNGIFDATFNQETTDLNLNSLCCIANDENYIYLAGYEAVNGESRSQWRLEKRDIETGELDTNFASSGVFTYYPYTSGYQIKDIYVDETSIYIIGNDYSGTTDQWRIIKMSKYNGIY